MKDFFILKLLDNFKFIYKKLGVDYKQVRLILQSKLIVDARKNSKNNNESCFIATENIIQYEK